MVGTSKEPGPQDTQCSLIEAKHVQGGWERSFLGDDIPKPNLQNKQEKDPWESSHIAKW